jgi:hypothetical protein
VTDSQLRLVMYTAAALFGVSALAYGVALASGEAVLLRISADWQPSPWLFLISVVAVPLLVLLGGMIKDGSSK